MAIMAVIPQIYTVQRADIYDLTTEQPLPLPEDRVWWIGIAARVFPALATTSKAKRERKAGRLTLNGDASASTNRPAVVGDCIAYVPLRTVWSTTTSEAVDGTVSTQLQLQQRQHRQSPQRWFEICRRQGLRIVFECDAFAVIVKPVGIHVNGRGWRTVEYALPALLSPPRASSQDTVLPTAHALHRLDYRVGGLLLVAKTRSAEVKLARQFESHRVVKRYRAILVGKLDPSEKLSVSPPSHFAAHALSMGTSGTTVFYVNTPLNGKPTCTALAVHSVSPSARYEWLTTVDLWPLTGRWHQLRIHMASLGHPIVGDDLHHHHRHHITSSSSSSSSTTSSGGGDVDDGAEARTPEVVRGAGLFLYAVALSFQDEVGNWRSFAIHEPHKFSRFRHFCALNHQKLRLMRAAPEASTVLG